MSNGNVERGKPTTVAVVGLGKIGLPLAVQFARNGCDVIGCDVAQARVDEVNEARSPFADEADLQERLAEVVAAGALRATTDTAAAVAQADIVVMIVPLIAGPDHRPDFRILESACDTVARGAHPGMLVCFETTMPVGSARRLGERIAKAAGLAPSDLRTAFSPERVYSGRIFADLATYPKLVGGVDAESTRAAADFYRSVLPDAEVWEMHSAEAAELAKLAETIYRDVNIALANELARYASGRGIDIAEVIRASNSQPFSHLHDPGIGVGGHCIPHYPWFVIADDPAATVMPAARALNDAQPAWALDRLAERLDGGLSGTRVLVLGLSYRAGVKEPTSSAGIDLVRLLPSRGAEALGHDPLFDDDEIRASGATPWPLERIGETDAVIVQATHAEYASIDWSALKPGAVVVDGRNALDREAIERAGAVYLGIGR